MTLGGRLCPHSHSTDGDTGVQRGQGTYASMADSSRASLTPGSLFDSSRAIYSSLCRTGFWVGNSMAAWGL
jgi:hypothetical protein